MYIVFVWSLSVPASCDARPTNVGWSLACSALLLDTQARDAYLLCETSVVQITMQCSFVVALHAPHSVAQCVSPCMRCGLFQGVLQLGIAQKVV